MKPNLSMAIQALPFTIRRYGLALLLCCTAVVQGQDLTFGTVSRTVADMTAWDTVEGIGGWQDNRRTSSVVSTCAYFDSSAVETSFVGIHTAPETEILEISAIGSAAALAHVSGACNDSVASSAFINGSAEFYATQPGHFRLRAEALGPCVGTFPRIVLNTSQLAFSADPESGVMEVVGDYSVGRHEFAWGIYPSASARDYGFNGDTQDFQTASYRFTFLASPQPIPDWFRGGGSLAPVIAQQSQSQSAVAGDSVTLSVEAFGSPPLSYQWRHHGEAIPGATNAFLMLPNASRSDQGDYDVVVSNSLGSVTSSTANVTVTPVITVEFVGRVVYVEDFLGVLDGSITVGSLFSGSYSFDPTTPDSNSDSTVGDYYHRRSGYGIEVSMGNYSFRTDPSNVDFLVEVVNRDNRDNYLLRSYNNLPSGGLQTSHIAWQLDDPTGTALANDQLPELAPDLSAWAQIFALTVLGDPRFFIRGEITSVTVVQPGTDSTNRAPAATANIPDASGTYGAPFSHTFPANTFTDPDAGQSLTCSASGLPNGISFDAASRTFSGTPTQTGIFIVTVTATDNGAPALSASTSFQLVVGPAPLTITANDQFKPFGGLMPPLSVRYDGFVNGDTEADLLTQPQVSTSATQSSGFGQYPITVSGASSANYEISYVDGTLTVYWLSHVAGPIINPANNHRYYLLDLADWFASEAAAQLRGGHLVTIRSQAENDFTGQSFR